MRNSRREDTTRAGGQRRRVTPPWRLEHSLAGRTGGGDEYMVPFLVPKLFPSGARSIPGCHAARRSAGMLFGPTRWQGCDKSLALTMGFMTCPCSAGKDLGGGRRGDECRSSRARDLTCAPGSTTTTLFAGPLHRVGLRAHDLLAYRRALHAREQRHVRRSRAHGLYPGATKSTAMLPRARAAGRATRPPSRRAMSGRTKGSATPTTSRPSASASAISGATKDA